jgi:hypothetical protein
MMPHNDTFLYVIVPPERVTDILGRYQNDEYGFLLNMSQLQSIASLDEADSKQLMHLLTGSSNDDDLYVHVHIF